MAPNVLLSCSNAGGLLQRLGTVSSTVSSCLRVACRDLGFRTVPGTAAAAGGASASGSAGVIGSMTSPTVPMGASAAALAWRRFSGVPLAARPPAGMATIVTAGRTAGCTAVAAAWRRHFLYGGAPVRSLWQDNKGYQHFQNRGRPWPFGSPRAMYGVALLVAAGGGYYLYCMETVPYTGRRHSIMLVSPASERWAGQMVFDQVVTQARAEGRLLPSNHPDIRRIRRVGTAIAAVAAAGGGGGYVDHMRNLDWEWVVVDNPAANAFVVPGGKVVVFSGLLQLLGGNESELAAVLAHEIGHVVARHSAERMSLLNVWALLSLAMRLYLGVGMPNLALHLGFFLPYARRAEHEADIIGLRLMARACFEPLSAPSMLEKIQRMENEMQRRGIMPAIPAFLRTHPLTEERVKRVEEELKAAYKLYYEAGCSAPRDAFSRGLGGMFGAGGGGRGGTDQGEGLFRFS